MRDVVTVTSLTNFITSLAPGTSPGGMYNRQLTSNAAIIPGQGEAPTPTRSQNQLTYEMHAKCLCTSVPKLNAKADTESLTARDRARRTNDYLAEVVSAPDR